MLLNNAVIMSTEHTALTTSTFTQSIQKLRRSLNCLTDDATNAYYAMMVERTREEREEDVKTYFRFDRSDPFKDVRTGGWLGHGYSLLGIFYDTNVTTPALNEVRSETQILFQTEL
jgi:hypothetical protein